MFYNELMSDFEMDEKDFEADSWSLAVDSSFLQQHKKEVMKKQDVIYGMLRALRSRPRCPFLLNQALLTRVFSLPPTCWDTPHPILGLHVPGLVPTCPCTLTSWCRWQFCNFIFKR